jgi:hypothetical protein
MVLYTGSYDSWKTLHVDGQDTGQTFAVDSYTQLNLQYTYTCSRSEVFDLSLGRAFRPIHKPSREHQQWPVQSRSIRRSTGV